ncbi:MAG: HNH endonuclease [Acidobacteriales bacterium]|nr:HNH endonuclease [Terriglobales bacterium]
MDRICRHCGRVIPPARKPSEYAKREFCSRECSSTWHREDITHLLKKVKVNPGTGCHIWTGYTDQKGYGHCGHQGKVRVVHRVIWEYRNGPVPEGLQLDHLCAVKSCCNPEHLRAVTARENSLADTSNNMAARNFRRLVCPKCGGPYSQFPNGVRYCKPCRNKKMMETQRVRRANRKLGIPSNQAGCRKWSDEHRLLYDLPLSGV